MSWTTRISLPSFDVFTDTNLDHYALYVDPTNVLIKEFTRGSVSLGGSANTTITHNLGYIPFFYGAAYGQFLQPTNGNGYLRPTSGGIITPPLYDVHADTSNLYIINNDSNTTVFWYYIFYDQQL